jgi:predicted porin
MKKILPLVCGLALCNGAFAQSNVAVYGVMDLGISVDKGGTSGTSTRVTSGMATQSRLGFRGTEDLGDGLAAFFVIEGGIHADNGTSTQNNTTFGRTTAVGLRGHFGTISAGLQDTPLFTVLNVVVDPLRNGIIRSNNLMPPTGFRASNSVLYRTPDVSGFNAVLMYVAGEVAGKATAGRALGGSFNYSSGPLNASLAYHSRNNDTATVSGLGTARNLLLGANYDFGPLRGYAGYEVNKGLNSAPLNNGAAVFGGPPPIPSTDSRDLLLAAAVPFGPNTIVLTCVHASDRTVHDQDATQLGVAYMYAFSKRSDVYTSYGGIHNRNGAAYTEGNSEEPGIGNRQFTMGLRHRF